MFDNTETKKVHYLRDWLTAFHEYRHENQGQFPTSFDQASFFRESGSDASHDFSPDQFQVVYHGSWKALSKPNETVLLTERSALQREDGGWIKMYGMADGSVVCKTGELRSLQQWEVQHVVKPKEPGKD